MSISSKILKYRKNGINENCVLYTTTIEVGLNILTIKAGGQNLYASLVSTTSPLGSDLRVRKNAVNYAVGKIITIGLNECILAGDLILVGTGDNHYLMWPRSRGDSYAWSTDTTTLGQPIWNDISKSYTYPSGKTADDFPAFKYTENLVYEYYNDWRMPAVNELVQLYTYGLAYITHGHYYWSSEEVDAGHAYNVSFNTGDVYDHYGKQNTQYIRPVRIGLQT